MEKNDQTSSHKMDRAILPDPIREAIAITENVEGYDSVPDYAIALMLRIDKGEITTDEAANIIGVMFKK